MNPHRLHRSHRYAKWMALALGLSLLLGCATSSPRDDLQYAQGLMAAGQLAEAHQVLLHAHVRDPSDKAIEQAYKESGELIRSRTGTGLMAKAGDAIAAQRWDEAAYDYQLAEKMPGFEKLAQAGQRHLAELRQQTAASAPAAVPQASSEPVSAPPVVAQRMTPAPAAIALSPATAPVAPVAVSAPTAAPAPAVVAAAPAAPSHASKAETVAPKSFMDEALQKKVTLQFRDASVRSLFDVIGKTSGLNVVIDRDVSPDLKTTIFLRDTTVQAAIQKITMTTQLAWRAMDDNSILVYSDDPAKQRDYQDLEVRSFYMTNADAKFVANSLKTVLKFRDMVVDDKLNMIVVRDTPEALRQADKLVAMLDKPEPEVMLEVEVLEVSRSLLKDLGVEWPASLALTPLATGGTTTTNTDGTTSTTGQLTLRDLMSLTPGKIGASIGATTLKAQRTDGDINVLASPRIRVKNKEKAKILIGSRVPNISSTITSTGFSSENINYVDVGLKLDVEPQVYADKQVVIKMGMEVSNIADTVTTTSGTKAYTITTRTASTVLRLKDGENQILAGLIQDSDKTSTTKIPGLGDIPILGHLFGSRHDDKSKTEIVLSITPHLIRGISRPSPSESSFDAGTITSVRGRRPEGEIVDTSQPLTTGQDGNNTNTSSPAPRNNAPRQRDE